MAANNLCSSGAKPHERGNRCDLQIVGTCRRFGKRCACTTLWAGDARFLRSATTHSLRITNDWISLWRRRYGPARVGPTGDARVATQRTTHPPALRHQGLRAKRGEWGLRIANRLENSAGMLLPAVNVLRAQPPWPPLVKSARHRGGFQWDFGPILKHLMVAVAGRRDASTRKYREGNLPGNRSRCAEFCFR